MVYRDKPSRTVTRLTGRSDGPTGPEGPPGTRWGYTNTWAVADSTDVACTMYDGDPPRVGDQLISLNGFSSGEVYTVSAVYSGTNNVDVVGYSPPLNLKGPKGNGWGTVPDQIVGPAGTQLSGVTITMNDGSLPAVGDMVLSTHADAIGDVYFVDSVTFGTNTGVIEKFNPPQNIRGAAGAPGSALSAWPINSVYISFANTNPATLFGGTWVSVGSGRMLIGVDSGDASMDAAGDTGGTKTETLSAANLPAHAHTINHTHADANSTGSSHTHNLPYEYAATTSTGGTGLRVTDIDDKTGGGGTNATAATGTSGSGHTHAIPAYSGSSGNGPGTATPVNNLPPYLAVYMWRRTA